MVIKIATYFSFLIMLISIAMPASIVEFATIDSQEFVKLSDFNDTDGDPSDDNSEEGSLEAEVLYVSQDHGIQVRVARILPHIELPNYTSSYHLKLFIPPSA